MVSCLIVNDSSHIGSTHTRTVEQFLSHVEVKQEHDKETHATIFYMHHIEKQTLWQIVFSLEMENIVVGYGFGHSTCEARKNAQQRLCIILREQNIIKKP